MLSRLAIVAAVLALCSLTGSVKADNYKVNEYCKYKDVFYVNSKMDDNTVGSI